MGWVGLGLGWAALGSDATTAGRAEWSWTGLGCAALQLRPGTYIAEPAGLGWAGLGKLRCNYSRVRPSPSRQGWAGLSLD